MTTSYGYKKELETPLYYFIRNTLFYDEYTQLVQEYGKEDGKDEFQSVWGIAHIAEPLSLLTDGAKNILKELIIGYLSTDIKKIDRYDFASYTFRQLQQRLKQEKNAYKDILLVIYIVEWILSGVDDERPTGDYGLVTFIVDCCRDCKEEDPAFYDQLVQTMKDILTQYELYADNFIEDFNMYQSL